MAELFNSFLIKSFYSNDNKDDVALDGIVYHYTSSEAFLNIIRERRVRFTDVRFLNDKSETLFFVKKLIDFIEKRSLEYPCFLNIVENMVGKIHWDKIKNLNVDKVLYKENTLPFNSDRLFVFCASKDADSLNMWNYYAKNGIYQGYNIGINLKKFIKTFDTDSSKKIDSFLVYHGNVLYEEKDQFSEIENLAKEIERKYNLVKMSNKTGKDSAVQELRSYAELQGLFYKSPKFKYEKEYRVVISISNKRIPHCEDEAKKYFGQNNKKMIEDYYSRGGLIVPALSVVLPQDSVSKVYISPKTEYEIAKASTKELLDNFGYRYNNKSINVVKSMIPIRY